MHCFGRYAWYVISSPFSEGNAKANKELPRARWVRHRKTSEVETRAEAAKAALVSVSCVQGTPGRLASVSRLRLACFVSERKRS